MKNKNLNRRDFLYQLGLSSAAVSVGGLLSACSSPTAVISNPALNPPDIELALSASPDEVQIFSGTKTNVWRYQGEVLRKKAGKSAIEK